MSHLSYSIISGIIFGLSAAVPIVLISYVVKVTRKYDLHLRTLPVFIFLYLAAWFITAGYFGYSSAITLRTLIVLASIPLLIGIFAILFSGSVRTVLKVIPMHWLVGLQVYRILGFMFLYLYFAEHFLSGGFAMSAGIGDIIAGITALPVAWMIKNKQRNYRLIAVLWNLYGILDLIAAPVSAVVFGNKGLNVYPIVLVPVFIGPPLSILVHAASLKNLWLTRATAGS